jgi:hypothetical protein
MIKLSYEHLYHVKRPQFMDHLIRKRWQEYEQSLDTQLKSINKYYNLPYHKIVEATNNFTTETRGEALRDYICGDAICNRVLIHTFMIYVHHHHNTWSYPPTIPQAHKLSFTTFNGDNMRMDTQQARERIISKNIPRIFIWANRARFTEFIKIEGNYAIDVVNQIDSNYSFLYHSKDDSLTLNGIPCAYIHITHKNKHNKRTHCVGVYATFNMRMLVAQVNQVFYLNHRRESRLSTLPREIVRHILIYL